jgi:RecJ-like exonuclease
MEVLTRSKCNVCGGLGVVTSHIWNEFFEIESKSDRAWEQEEVDEWFRRRGYGTLPSEEPTCFECEGTGEIEKWMDVHEILEKANIIG